MVDGPGLSDNFASGMPGNQLENWRRVQEFLPPVVGHSQASLMTHPLCVQMRISDTCELSVQLSAMGTDTTS